MSATIPRRSLLSTGAALATTGVLVAATELTSPPEGDEGAAPPVVVRWNAKRRKWATRPPKADFGVVFLSTNDPTAEAPTHGNLQSSDVWRRHPDAVEA